MKLSRDQVLDFSAIGSIYVCKPIDMTVCSGAAVNLLADYKVEREDEFVVVAQFDQESRHG